MARELPGIPLDDRLIVALDLPEERALPLVRQLKSEVGIFKVGLELALSSGLGILDALGEEGVRVFLDLKLLDIPETVTRALNAIQSQHEHIVFATVHAFNRGIETALRAKRRADFQVLVVTLLTSMDEEDLRQLGIGLSAEAFVLQLARRAAAAGCGGVISSALEAAAIRAACPELTIVTPAIRPDWGGVRNDDQKRAATPRQAILNGADHLVVGRPIYGSDDPAAAARRIREEIAAALQERERMAGQDGPGPSTRAVG